MQARVFVLLLLLLALLSIRNAPTASAFEDAESPSWHRWEQPVDDSPDNDNSPDPAPTPTDSFRFASTSARAQGRLKATAAAEVEALRREELQAKRSLQTAVAKDRAFAKENSAPEWYHYFPPWWVSAKGIKSLPKPTAFSSPEYKGVHNPAPGVVPYWDPYDSILLQTSSSVEPEYVDHL